MVYNPTYSDVFVSETQLLNIIAEIGFGTSAIVFSAKRGPLTPQFVTNTRQWKQLFGPNDPTVNFANYCALDIINGGGSIWGLRVVGPGTTYPGLALNDNGVYVASPTPPEDPADFVIDPTTSFLCYPTGPGAWGNNLAVFNTATNPKDNTFKLHVYVMPNLVNPVEIWTVSKLHQVNYLTGQSQYIEDVVNVFSNYIRVIDNPMQDYTPDKDSNLQQFSGGDDGAAVGDTEICDGWQQFNDFKNYPNVNLLINGGYTTPAVQMQMLETAELRGDAVALLDMPFLDCETVRALNYRNVTLNADTDWGSIHTPWYLRNDEDNRTNLFVPPSGAKAARILYATNNAYPWQASAGVVYGRIPNALGLSYLYQDGERALIEDPAQINPITTEPGYGICFQNDKTLQGYLAPMSYQSIRILVIIIRQSIRNYLQTIRWQPNDQYTRNRVVSAINTLLDLIRGQRGLASFNVVSDSSNNTDYTIALGQLIIDVALQPVFPAEKVMLNLIVTANTVQVNVTQGGTGTTFSAT